MCIRDSSACELVTELLQYIAEPTDLLRTEAEALLAGIVLDTKNFTMRTGGRTFEAAAFLRRSGADTGEVKRLFQNDLSGTIAKYDIIQNAKLYRDHIAIAVVDHTVGRVTAAQAADELLNIVGISTSFVLFPDGEQIIISGPVSYTHLDVYKRQGGEVFVRRLALAASRGQVFLYYQDEESGQFYAGPVDEHLPPCALPGEPARQHRQGDPLHQVEVQAGRGGQGGAPLPLADGAHLSPCLLYTSRCSAWRRTGAPSPLPDGENGHWSR